ncbi:MAG: PQQ-dependent catabolism-associated beta-propeller protein [Geminicoccaceae bacterium]|nr:PQQ-dependent catabolism-associated beta-propeller protein [Geminicoccaceae bacterium]MCS7266478.1 PQQ-dependent catabolism-associated beta-propeller protein [Geminicoccaceae bacterium]MCX7629393.1 PQQ-dependent catabolism-associated beta-propeller protein [Geminicoccaceae bacterium]MDW8123926.1 PQQ-dependent catabolism-associated beta-propeller protein [Geminicoccaceae bacterium]MDW8340011.1 PQQ-dependent catabolism-associated beta-propeller protein [Geminicoccaceae bacterium]
MTRAGLAAVCALVLLALSDGRAAAAEGFAIVSNEKSGNFSVYDLEGNLLRTVPACGRPRGMVFTKDKKEFLVCCAEDNMIGVFDTMTQKLVRRITNVLYPEVHYLHPNGRHLYVSNEEDSQATVFDLETGRMIAAYDTGAEPEGIVVTEDGKLAFVASEAANLLHVIDIEKQEVVKDILMNTRPRRLALTPDGKELWVSAEIAGMVDIVDIATLELVHTIDFEYRGLRKENITPVDVLIDSKGQRAYVALGRANHVAVVDVKTRRVTDYVLVGRRPWGLALDKNETRLWVTNGLSDDVTIVDTRTLKPLKSVPAGEVPHSVLIWEP